MKRVRRAYRKMKDRIRNFDLQNQQHQLLIVLVIVATLLFALLHSVMRSIFFTDGRYSISEATMQVQLIDAKCWGESEDNAVWKTELKYVNCRSKDNFSIYGNLYNETGDDAGIRHKFRTIYENDVVKHLSQQIKFDDFTSNTSKVCNIHMLDHMNLYFNHNVVHFLNISHDHNHSSSGNSANRLNAQQQHQQQRTQQLTRSALQHSRLSDAGMCAQLSYTGSNGGVGNNALVKCLPSFIIAGVMKSGTGELMKWLNTHPNLVSGSGPGGKNEIHYFSHHQLPQFPDSDTNSLAGSKPNEQRIADNKSNVPPLNNTAKSKDTRDNVNRERTSKNVTSAVSHSHHQRTLRESTSVSDSIRPVANFLDYLQYFPSFHGTNQADTLYTFDKSPDYIRSPNVIYNIRNMLPSVKLVILLRDPVQRAISAFNHNCRHGRYVKLSRNVVVEGELLGKGSVLSTESSEVHFSRNSSSNSAASNRTTSRLTYSVSLSKLSKKDYTVLTYPCTAADMHAYFFGAAQTRTAGEHRHRQTSELGPNATGAPVQPRATANKTITSSVKDNALLQIDDHDCAPEIAHGFYDAQLSYVLKIFPRDQVLILFQENMYKNTFKTLREVETFLSLPCFDYSTVTLLPSTSNGLSFDDREDGKQLPPKRAPVTIEETLTHYKNVVKSFFETKRPSTSSSSSKLQRETSPLTRALLSSIFSRHNRQLQELLLRYQMTKQANYISELKWDM